MQNIKTLIVGAGVAGLTCAGLLTKQGIEPVVVEKENETSFNSSGYMLGLLPLGGRVLNALDAREAYFKNSIQMESYDIHRADGALIKHYPLDFINEKYGSYRGITRTALIDILLKSAGEINIKYDTTVKAINRRPDGNELRFSDGQTQDFDLVIIADGLHSQTRSLILDKDEHAYNDTGWGGWVTWLDEEPMRAYKEYWGNGSFLGLYPVKDKVGVFLGGPVDEIREKGLDDFRSNVQRQIATEFEQPHRALQAFDEAEGPFFWQFQDGRSQAWVKDQVVLLGDAATGFLPTAGVGASMAMDSAAALADELSRVNKAHLGYGLELFVQRQKGRVEKAQKDSRRLGKMMFIESTMMAKIRNKILPFYCLQRLLSDLAGVMEGE